MSEIQLVQGPPGLGKTTRVLDQIAMNRVRVAFMGPTHKLLDQVRTDLWSRRVKAQKRPEFTKQTCPAGEHDKIARYYRIGLDPTNLICGNCPFLSNHTCPYWKQVERVKKARVALYATARVRYGDSFLGSIHDRLLVFDEDPTEHLAPTIHKRRCDIEGLILLYERAKKNVSGEALSYLERRCGLLSRLLAVVDRTHPITVVHGRDLRVGDDARVAAEDRRSAHEALRKARSSQGGEGRIRASAETGFFEGLLDFIRREPEARVGLIDRIEADEPTVTLGYRVRLPAKARVLILDGTGTRDHYEALFNPFGAGVGWSGLEVVGDVVAHDSKITQLLDQSFSVTSLDRPETFERAVQIIETINKREGGVKPALICHKRHESAFVQRLSGKFQTGHFRALRGLNAFEDTDVGFVLGPPRPPFALVRATAALLYGASETELAETRKSLKFQRNGRTFRTQGFSGNLLARAWRYHVTSELIQAVGRFRYLRTAKRIYILTTEIIELPEIEPRFASADPSLPPILKRERKDRRWCLEQLLSAARSLLARGIVINTEAVAAASGYPHRRARRYWKQIVEQCGLKRKGRGHYAAES